MNKNMNTETAAAPAAIRVIIAEDQTMVLGALAALLEMESDIDVIAQVRNGREALQAVFVHKPDVVVTDIEMPEMTGLELAAHLKGRSTAKVIVVTTFARPGYLRRALDAGAQGYLLKDSPARELANAVRRVHQGHRVIDSELAAEALAEDDPLTDRERQVLRLAGDGASSEEIAKKLGLSDGTVRNYLSEAIGKLSAANRTDAARIARAKGWL
jgi:two-component system, NarL family, response regulator DesR